MTDSQHPVHPTDPRTVSELAEAVHGGLPTTIADLSSLVRIPSVSWDAFDPAHVAESAEAVARLVRETGLFDEVTVSRAPIGSSGSMGQPAVLARREARDGKKTVLLYAHHDVQPQGDDAHWDTPPFEPTLKGERLYGRGASDDKAGVMTHIAALRAVRDVFGDDLGVGVSLFIEGEEEFGSRSFADFLEQHRDVLEADVIVVADSDNWSTTVPAITVALRGNVTFRLTVRTLAHASHSGMLGGVVPDAMMAMVRLLATLHDEEGGVAVSGLHSRDAEHPDQSEETLREESGLLEGVRTIGRGPLLSRVWSQPSITVTGIDAPSVANASNTLSPEVSVRISARIAPGQPAAEAFEALRDHLLADPPFGAHVTIDDVDTGDPFLVDTSGPAIADVTVAMSEGWGQAPVQTGIGGSIPFIADLVKTFPDAEILVTGVEDPDTRAHSPNESQHLGVLQKAILSEAILLARLDAAGR